MKQGLVEAYGRRCGFAPVENQSGATGVLYDHSTGLTLLVHAGEGNDREFFRNRAPMMIVFSFECENGWPVHLPIIETAHVGRVRSLRRLVQRYADGIPPQHRLAPERALTPAGRKALAAQIGRLSSAAHPQAAEGFLGAVAFCLDERHMRPCLRLLPGGLAASPPA